MSERGRAAGRRGNGLSPQLLDADLMSHARLGRAGAVCTSLWRLGQHRCRGRVTHGVVKREGNNRFRVLEKMRAVGLGVNERGTISGVSVAWLDAHIVCSVSPGRRTATHSSKRVRPAWDVE